MPMTPMPTITHSQQLRLIRAALSVLDQEALNFRPNFKPRADEASSSDTGFAPEHAQTMRKELEHLFMCSIDDGQRFDACQDLLQRMLEATTAEMMALAVNGGMG